MDEQDVLRHLLAVEAEASALVDDAQAEADRRVTEGEKQNRLLYDEQYGRETARLEAQYGENIERVKADYKKQLDSYRESLDAMPVNTEAFIRAVESFLEKDR
jgi:regulator of protease activity HflC (stomatin/prohibitin superfamily)